MADTKYNSLDPKLSTLFNNLEQENNLPNGLLQAVAYTESRYKPNATSPVGAKGMFQFMPKTAEQYKVDVSDPVSSAQGAAKMYADLLKQHKGDLNKALAGYNWGSGNIQKKGMENMPDETRNYISKINGLMNNSSDQKKNNMNIPPEAIEAYKQFKAQQAQPQENVQPQQNQAFNIQPQQVNPQENVQPQQVNPQENVQPQQVNPQQINPEQIEAETNPFTIDAQKNLNQQSANINYQPNKNFQIFKDMIGKMNNGQDYTQLWTSLSNNQKKEIGRFLKEEFKQNGDPTGALENAWQGLNYSAQKTNDSIEQIGNYLNPVAAANGNYTKNTNEKNKEIARNQALREINDEMNPSVIRNITEFGGDVAQLLAGGGIAKTAGQGLIVKGASKTARAADLALEGAGASIVQNPVVNAQNPENTNFLTDKLIQAGTAGVLAPVIGLPVEKLAGTIATKTSKLNQSLKQDYSEADKLAIKQFEENGLKNWTPDMLPSASNELKDKVRLSNLKDSKTREYTDELKKQINTKTDEFKSDIPKTDRISKEIGLDNIIEDTNNVYRTKAKELKDKISNIESDDVNAIVKYSAEAKKIVDQSKSRELYNISENLAPKNTKVELKSAEDILNKAKKELNDLSTTTQKNKIKSVVDDLESTIEKAKNGKNSYSDINKYFREIGDNARQAKRTGDDNAARIYNDFKNALNKDKDDFINSLPDSKEVRAYKKAYEEATNFNRENIQNIKKNKLESLFNSENSRGTPNLPDKLIEKLVKKGETEKVKLIYESLPDVAKDTIQSTVRNNLIKASLDESGDVIPKKFVSAYKAYEEKTSGKTPLSVIFDKDMKKTFDNYVTMLSRMENIGSNKTPMNGASNNAVLKSLETMGTLASLKSGNFIAAIKPIANFVNNKAFVKGLTDLKFKKLLSNLNNINPKTPKFVEKIGEISSYISQNFNDK